VIWKLDVFALRCYNVKPLMPKDAVKELKGLDPIVEREPLQVSFIGPSPDRGDHVPLAGVLGKMPVGSHPPSSQSAKRVIR
jgi:hypothetical protein